MSRLALSILIGLMALCLTVLPIRAEATASETKNDHHHQAPHGGALLELGEEFAHVEFVLNASRGTLSAYVLDHSAEAGVRIKSPTLRVWLSSSRGSSVAVTPRLVVLKAVANALSGETVGDTSEFNSEPGELRGLTRWRGRLEAIEVKGQTFRNLSFDFTAGEQ